MDEFRKQQKATKLIDEKEIYLWRRIVEGDEKKLWEYIKRMIKKRTILRQEENWNLNKVGKVLRRHKINWYEDPVINTIENPMVHFLKRMRIGNSRLRSHWNKGKAKTCVKCKDNKEETNKHFLLECTKYMKQRREMKSEIKGDLDKLGKDITTKNLLGFFPEIYESKKKVKQTNRIIKKILNNVVNYIRKTKRFQQ